jgi:hypothetical protein
VKQAVALAAAVVLLVGALGLVLWLRAAPNPWSVLLIVSEPPTRAWLEPEGPAARTPRLDRLGGAGVRLPLAAPTLSAGEWLGSVLGGEAPERSLLRATTGGGWRSIGASQVPVSADLAGRFTRFAQSEDPESAVDAVLAGMTEALPGPGLAVVVAVLQPTSPRQLEQAAARLIDGVAPWLPPSQTVVVVVDRGKRSAVLVAPSRPSDLEINGALGPAELGDAIARWLKLPLE